MQPAIPQKAGMPRWTVAALRARSSSWASLCSAAARLAFRPSISPSQPYCSAGPEPPARHLATHRRRSRSRCQHKIVSGGTTSRNPARRGLGITPVSTAINPRSAQVNLGLEHLLPLKHTQLVTEQQDLRLFPRRLPASQPQPRERTDNDEIDEPQAHNRPSCSPEADTASPPHRSASMQVTRRGRDFRHAQEMRKRRVRGHAAASAACCRPWRYDLRHFTACGVLTRRGPRPDHNP